MRFRAVLVVFAVVSALDGLIAILAPHAFLHAIWPARQMADATLFVSGWGACLLAMSALAWTNRNAQDSFVCRSISLSLFMYFSIAAAIWLADALTIGWTPLSAATFIGLAVFATTFGYLRVRLSSIRRMA
jgi:uncharacterized protein YjeT (DUF2065 family)